MFPATAVAEPPLPNNNKFETCVWGVLCVLNGVCFIVEFNEN
jgi:hypothetical protein